MERLHLSPELAAAAPRALVSVEDAAKRLGSSPPTVRRMLASGELPGVRLGGRWRVDLAALGRRARPEIAMETCRRRKTNKPAKQAATRKWFVAIRPVLLRAMSLAFAGWLATHHESLIGVALKLLHL